MKHYTFALLATATLLLSGCSTTTPDEIIQESDLVLIINHMPTSICDPNPLKDKILEEILPNATLRVIRDDNPTASCDIYGVNAIGCEEIDYQEYLETEDESLSSCILGASREDDLLAYVEEIVVFIQELVD